MNFLKIEDEMKYFQRIFMLRKEIENFLFKEGYMNIEPSIFEEYDEFTSVNSRIDKKSTVKILESNSDILILSPDITTGIINKFMPRWDYDLMLKIFYYGKTYKHNGNGIKEKREIGIEIIGDNSQNIDQNTLMTAERIISRYSDNYLLEIGNSKFLKGIMLACSFNKEDYDNILDLLYLKNKQELDDYLSKLNYKEPICTLLNILDLEGTYEEITGKLEGLYLNDMMKAGLQELKTVDDYMKNITDKIIYDLSMVSELSYYDGIIFRGYIHGSNTEIIKGGRYDSFTEQFGVKIPAIGFTVELDELLKAIYKEG
ncbi:MAG TPA: ATP phosphoribosyltransferase regulatory subunit [Sedimentibacter sp.]|nr:ATP phosphoribosyltransferase regulatory subunit [Sedimentibacter sp.]HNZ82693.1 ATP phosphoribosyltransferase regulatory subunit [Sedimentibacter sp.]HOH69847.1 ATP phosphoribosyltransferase regulatory subunit [Sedimentibacter sp.]HPW99231.1 ATP phosphoribosyltransferase regulatory subunit [Sedimentibacter sp.]HQB63323.1 ATP phosphoribosyltransferase regulatory subunit [Sedimentibacter sp.]